MRVRHSVCIVAVVSMLVACDREARALGQLPLQTDEPETPRKNALKLDLAYGFDSIRLSKDEATARRHLTRKDMSVPTVQLNYGITDRIQARLEGSHALTTASPHGGTAYGFGDLSAGLKYRFLDQSGSSDEDEDEDQSEDGYGWEGPVSASVFPQWTFPTGSARRGLGAGEYSLYVPLDVSRDMGKVVLLGEGAFLWRYHRRSNPNAFQLGAAAYYQLRERLWLLGENRLNLPTVGQRTAEWIIALGAWYDLTDHVAIYGSAGRSIRASAAVEQTDVMVLVGLEILVGRPR